MSTINIIETWSSESMPLTRANLISNELIKLYSKFTGKTLVNLYNLDEVFDTSGWYIEKNKGEIFRVNLNIDSINLVNENNDKEILEELKINYYTKITFFLEAIKRNQVYDKRNLFESINIYEPNKSPEYFKLIDFKSEEVPITKVNKKRTRKNSVDNSKQSKKLKKDEIDWSSMISASSTRNYFLNDPLIDWIKEYNITSINDKPSSRGNSTGSIKYEIDDPFTKFIMNQGNKFEETIIDIIKKNHKLIQVAESFQSRNPDLYKKTIDCMKEGHPIIYQGILHNYENKTFGAPDLMIRSDYLNKFVGYNVYNETFGSPKLGVKWHYVIVDIKHSQINLTSDAIHIRNDDSIPAYKGQLLVYTNAINNMQGTNVTKAFILGKKYSYTVGKNTFEISDLMNKLGTIDYAGFDKDYVTKLVKAIEWIQLVRKDGQNWKLLPMPTREELFPNMKNDRDGAVARVKKQLAEEIHEITSVYYCGVKNRKAAFENGVFSWNDEKCNSEVLGFQKGKISQRIDCILKINRQNNVIVSPSKINYTISEWRNRKDNEMEFYLDYETMNSNFGSIIVDKNQVDYEDFNFVFMIGVGHENMKKEWQFKSFVAEQKSKAKEEDICNKFWDYVNEQLKLHNKTTPVFIHWSQAERSVYNKLQQRYKHLPDINLIDLYQVFIEEPVVVKGALNYSLKSIAKALYENKLINTIWDTTSQCSNGLNAMLIAYNLYNKNTSVSIQLPMMKEIEVYNEIDCKCLWDIINYLRKNH